MYLIELWTYWYLISIVGYVAYENYNAKQSVILATADGIIKGTLIGVFPFVIPGLIVDALS